MDTSSFWFYTLAAAFLVWGLLGLRFGLSVLAANALLALLISLLPGPFTLNSTEQVMLLLGYPVYWGAAFFVLRFLEDPPLPAMPVALRFLFCFLLALGFGAAANWGALQREGRLFYGVYLADTEKRPSIIADVFSRSDYTQVCEQSHATLMGLAISNRDTEVVRVLLHGFRRCKSAGATVVKSVRPFFDVNDAATVAFLLESGLEPSSLVFGADYANGTALAYAACEGKEELVRLIVRHNPKDAADMRYLEALFETLRQKDDIRMLRVLREEGLLNAEHPERENAEQPERLNAEQPETENAEQPERENAE